MSESVWFEQVDAALIKFLRENIFIENKNIKVVVRKPDDDFSLEEYPVISIYNLQDRFSVERYNDIPVVISKDTETGKAIVEEPALPYDLSYQIDFWSNLQEDMNSMTLQWKSLTKRYFNLPVVDMSGVERNCFVLPINDFSKADLFSQNKRLFHSFGTYRISVEIDENVRKQMPIVIEREIV